MVYANATVLGRRTIGKGCVVGANVWVTRDMKPKTKKYKKEKPSLLDIEFNNIKGYVSFYVDFFENNDFKNIENRKYVELPTELDSKITMVEIFDTNDFIDFIDSEVILEFGDIDNDKIKMVLSINDKLVKLEYQGLLNVK